MEPIQLAAENVALKNKVASLTGEAINHSAAFSILVTRWKTLVTDIKVDLGSAFGDNKINKDLHELLSARLDFMHNNLSYASGVGLYDMSDHLKIADTPLSVASPATLPPLVPIPTGNAVSVSETGGVTVDTTPTQEATPPVIVVEPTDIPPDPQEVEGTPADPIEEVSGLHVEPKVIQAKVEEIQAKLEKVKQDLKV